LNQEPLESPETGVSRPVPD